jgi:hypothetical protein
LEIIAAVADDRRESSLKHELSSNSLSDGWRNGRSGDGTAFQMMEESLKMIEQPIYWVMKTTFLMADGRTW